MLTIETTPDRVETEIQREEETDMFGKTFTITASLFGIWLLGVGALAFGPTGNDTTRTTVRPTNAIVSVPYQTPSGKFTVYVRTPMVMTVYLPDTEGS